MRARVTNLSRGARGFHTADGGTALVDPGASTVLDLAPHPAHDAWVAIGEVTVSPEEQPGPVRTQPPAHPAMPDEPGEGAPAGPARRRGFRS